jgi:hypothetical protein
MAAMIGPDRSCFGWYQEPAGRFLLIADVFPNQLQKIGAIGWRV